MDMKKIVLGSSFYHAWDKIGYEAVGTFILRWISNTKFTRHNAAAMAIFMQMFSAYFSNPPPENATSWVVENCVQIFIEMKREFIMTSHSRVEI